MVGIFNFLTRIRKKRLTAQPVKSSLASDLFPQDNNNNPILVGHENYDQVIDYPNIMGPLNQNAAFHNPQRLHAPYAVRRNSDSYTTAAGKMYFDGADQRIQRLSRSDLQVQFDTKKEIPIPPALIPSTGVEVPSTIINYGWSQSHVPSNGMYQPSVLVAPVTKRSENPGAQKTVTVETHRVPLKATAKSPKRSVN